MGDPVKRLICKKAYYKMANCKQAYLICLRKKLMSFAQESKSLTKVDIIGSFKTSSYQ